MSLHDNSEMDERVLQFLFRRHPDVKSGIAIMHNVFRSYEHNTGPLRDVIRYLVLLDKIRVVQGEGTFELWGYCLTATQWLEMAREEQEVLVEHD